MKHPYQSPTANTGVLNYELRGSQLDRQLILEFRGNTPASRFRYVYDAHTPASRTCLTLSPSPAPAGACPPTSAATSAAATPPASPPGVDDDRRSLSYTASVEN